MTPEKKTPSRSTPLQHSDESMFETPVRSSSTILPTSGGELHILSVQPLDMESDYAVLRYGRKVLRGLSFFAEPFLLCLERSNRISLQPKSLMHALPKL
jgi:hypothetical protein